MIRSIHPELWVRLRAVPPILALGVVVFGLGSLADVFYHAAPATWLPVIETYLGADGELAHLTLFVGMTIIVAALVQAGLRASRSAATPASSALVQSAQPSVRPGQP